MSEKETFWKRIGLQDWFLKKDEAAAPGGVAGLTPDDVYRYLLQKFEEGVRELSFANRVVFYHEYIICFNPEDYRTFMENRKGIFGLIVQESVRQFYDRLKDYRSQGREVAPSASKWVFRFVSHPDYARGDKSFIGKLLPGASGKDDNLRVTFIPRQTGIAQTFDINPDILQGFHFYSEGYYEVPFAEEGGFDAKPVPKSANAAAAGGGPLARLETILPDKAFAGRKLEFLMMDEEITVSGPEETKEAPHIFRVPSEWVNTPHLRIRYDRKEGRFSMASFGEKTVLNESEVRRSSPDRPEWTDLPVNSRIMLNGIVGINLFKS